jgi:hypothetical protein
VERVPVLAEYSLLRVALIAATIALLLPLQVEAQGNSLEPKPQETQTETIRDKSLDLEEAQAEKTISSQEHGMHKSLFSHFVDQFYFWRLHYYFVAQNAANCDLFYGLVQDDPLIGRASVDFIFPNGCQCKGYALVTHYAKLRSTVGQEGFIKAKCSDGRVIRGRFKTTSLTTGNGNGSDNLGNNYEFTFGHTAEQAVLDINALRKKLGCEECNPEDVQLKVTGKILPPSK